MYTDTTDWTYQGETAWERFEARIAYEPMSGCWLWTGSTDPCGYGKVSIRGKIISTHVVSYTKARGPVPAALELDHLCRTPQCVNPDHLEAVTRRENVLRGLSPMARNARLTHCLRGHEFTSDSTYPPRPNRGHERRCKLCVRAASRERYAASRR